MSVQQKLCPRCLSDHTKPGIYCSRACANSRQFSAETNERKRIAAKRVWDSLSSEQKAKSVDLLRLKSDKYVKICVDKLMVSDWNSLSPYTKRYRLILEQRGACNKCGITHWNGEPITLEYEHKDGDRTNNLRSNVEGLCPNCHSQTLTWRGKKNGKRQKRAERYLSMI